MHYKLIEEIILLSNSKEWEKAKLEWNFDSAYMSDSSQRCLCGHSIKEICVIRNQVNLISTEVGNCCVNKFLVIDNANKIFESVKRIKKDITKSMSYEVLVYLYNKKIIKQNEFDFYNDIIKKRKLSNKQEKFKVDINLKLNSFTNYETNSTFSKINKVLNWAEKNPEFDISFVQSLKMNCIKFGKLTDSQSRALDNIIIKFSIT